MLSSRRRLIPTAVLLLLASACTTQTVVTQGPASDVAPTLVVEQFMRAVNANDLDTMARLFGTRDGPIADRDPVAEVDDRMFAIASILRHRDYGFEGTRLVPGRRDEATQLLVGIVLPNDERVTVPFTMIFTRSGNWLVEQIDVERITNRR